MMIFSNDRIHQQGRTSSPTRYDQEKNISNEEDTSQMCYPEKHINSLQKVWKEATDSLYSHIDKHGKLSFETSKQQQQRQHIQHRQQRGQRSEQQIEQERERLKEFRKNIQQQTVLRRTCTKIENDLDYSKKRFHHLAEEDERDVRSMRDLLWKHFKKDIFSFMGSTEAPGPSISCILTDGIMTRNVDTSHADTTDSYPSSMNSLTDDDHPNIEGLTWSREAAETIRMKSFFSEVYFSKRYRTEQGLTPLCSFQEIRNDFSCVLKNIMGKKRRRDMNTPTSAMMTTKTTMTKKTTMTSSILTPNVMILANKDNEKEMKEKKEQQQQQQQVQEEASEEVRVENQFEEERVENQFEEERVVNKDAAEVLAEDASEEKWSMNNAPQTSVSCEVPPFNFWVVPKRNSIAEKSNLTKMEKIVYLAKQISKAYYSGKVIHCEAFMKFLDTHQKRLVYAKMCVEYEEHRENACLLFDKEMDKIRKET